MAMHVADDLSHMSGIVIGQVALLGAVMFTAFCQSSHTSATESDVCAAIGPTSRPITVLSEPMGNTDQPGIKTSAWQSRLCPSLLSFCAPCEYRTEAGELDTRINYPKLRVINGEEHLNQALIYVPTCV